MTVRAAMQGLRGEADPTARRDMSSTAIVTADPDLRLPAARGLATPARVARVAEGTGAVTGSDATVLWGLDPG